MRLISLLLSLLMFLELSFYPLPAGASPVSFAPGAAGVGGSLQGEVPVNKVGKLLLADGVAIFKDNSVDVVGTPPGATQKQNVLSGVCFKVDATGAGTKPSLKGQCYFRSGPGLSQIDDPSQEELIDLVDGGVVSGHIVAINHEEVEVEESGGNRRRFAMGGVKAIRSPRVYSFTVPCVAAAPVTLGTAFSGECTRMTFTPTASGKVAVAKPPKPTQPSQPSTPPPSASSSGGGEGWTPKKIILGGAIMCGIACAIALPIAIPLATRGKNNTRRKREQFINQVNAINIIRAQQPRVPSSP